MAEVTVELVNVRGFTVLTVTYDDITEVLDKLVLVTDRPTRIELWRNSNNVWRSGIVEAGTHVYEAGGPVKKLEDLERLVVSVDF